jgi:hypothetical protein
MIWSFGALYMIESLSRSSSLGTFALQQSVGDELAGADRHGSGAGKEGDSEKSASCILFGPQERQSVNDSLGHVGSGLW